MASLCQAGMCALTGQNGQQSVLLPTVIKTGLKYIHRHARTHTCTLILKALSHCKRGCQIPLVLTYIQVKSSETGERSLKVGSLNGCKSSMLTHDPPLCHRRSRGNA